MYLELLALKCVSSSKQMSGICEPLPVQDGLVMLEVSNDTEAPRREAPLQHMLLGRCTDGRIELLALIPEPPSFLTCTVDRRKTAPNCGLAIWRSGSIRSAHVLPPPAEPP
uniref:Uncharacterized protein n=2 Tax=Sinorhizobium TaxID=28105 RepID=I2E1I6_RHIML|nr:short hypothetical protein [Sinorhizobium meliloti]